MMPKIIVDLAGLMLIFLVVWFFWFSKKKGERVESVGGVQGALITVKGGYTPDVVIVKAGKPVRLTFIREESAACSERVVFNDFGKSEILPQGERVNIEFTPEKPGEYEFACQMGMFKGMLVVE